METTASTPDKLTPNAGSALVEFIRTNRQTVASGLGGLSLVLLLLFAFFLWKSVQEPSSTDKTPDKTLSNPFDPDKPLEAPKPVGETVNLKKGDYNVGLVASLLACLGIGVTALWFLARLPSSNESEQRTEARVAILAVGQTNGIVTILAGLILFYRWSDSISGWLDKGEGKEAKWVLIPLLMLVIGAASVFFAIQPARADERNDTLIRKLVYGSNFGLTIMLLIVAIVVVNVLISLKVPNKLDTTVTGLYSISDNMKLLLSRLDPPVTAYAVLPDIDHHVISDVRQFLLICQEASGGKFNVKFISTSTDKNEMRLLESKYPKLDLALRDRQQGRAGAVIIAAGAEEKKSEVIPVLEFYSTQDRQDIFVGESRLFKELTALSDQTKPVVYFTQSNGELQIPASSGDAGDFEPDVQVPDDQKATRLKKYLKKNYLEVQPLTLSGPTPTVPENASIVVIAGPQVEFDEKQIGALRKYLVNPHGKEGKKGKLIVLTGPATGPKSKRVPMTGLEPLLGEFNVTLGNKYVYTIPTPQIPYAEIAVARFSAAALNSNQPIATTIDKANRIIPMTLPREVTASQNNQAYRAMTLLDTYLPTWVEDERQDKKQIQSTYQEWRQTGSMLPAKNLIAQGRPLGVVVSEGASPRLAVYGSDEFVSDLEAKDMSPEKDPASFILIGVTIDWLRERPSIAAVGIDAKRYVSYTFPNPIGVDFTHLLTIPLILGCLTVIGLGAGVWVTRRK
jgi:hypothetical protein